eukprot:Awhi_evm1s10443
MSLHPSSSHKVKYVQRLLSGVFVTLGTPCLIFPRHCVDLFVLPSALTESNAE